MAIINLYQNLTSFMPSIGLPVWTIFFLSTGVLTYYAFFDPLRKIPGPLICRLTSFWTWYHSYVGDECRLIDDLFKIYGPVVRVAPNEVVIKDGAALAPIYSEKGGFLKAPCYSNFDFEGHSTIFSALNPGHRQIRSKAVLPLFSIGCIRSRMNDIEECVDEFVRRVQKEAAQSKSAGLKTGKSTPVNLLNLSRSLSLDSVCAYLFGRSYDGILEETNKMSAAGFVDSAVAIGRVFYFPNWQFRLFDALTAKFQPASEDVERSVEKVNGFAEKIVDDNNEEDNTYQSRLLKAGISRHETVVQCKDLMFAGTDSTGTNLAKILWHLTRQPKVFQKLRAEIAEAEENDPTINPQAIPYLDAVVREGLRIGMANPTRLPRVVPAGGFNFTSKNSGSFFIPPGCLVGVQTYSLHFNPEVYPDPFAFEPERWIRSPNPEMQRDWFPFGLGSRQCIARNLAHIELLVTVRAVAKADLLRGARTVADRIEIIEWFNSKVVGDRIDLVWE